jgi:hypothetical protein
MVLIEDIVEEEETNTNDGDEFHSQPPSDDDFEDAESPCQSPEQPSRDGEMFESCCVGPGDEPVQPGRSGEMFESCMESAPPEVRLTDFRAACLGILRHFAAPLLSMVR